MSAPMVLAEDARDGAGRLLLPRGASVDEAQLAVLRRRGASVVLVMEDSDAEAAPAPDAEAIGARVDRLFRRSPDDGPTRTLREWLLRYRLGTKR